MARIPGFICDVCGKTCDPGSIWELRPAAVSVHSPPDGINHGLYEFNEVCMECRTAIDRAVRETIQECRKEET